MLRMYATNVVIAKDIEEIRNFKQVLLTPWDFPLKLWNLSLMCSGVYNEETLPGFLIEKIDLSPRSTMRHWLEDNRKVILEDLAHQA